MPKNKKLTREESLDHLYRRFNFLLYPDCPEHKQLIELFLNPEWQHNEDVQQRVQVVGIEHNRDVWNSDDEAENPEHKAGEKKKLHYHFVVEWVNQTSIKRLAKRFNISEAAIQLCDDERGSKRYLLHTDNADKAAYFVSELLGNDIESVLKYVQGSIRQDAAARIICDIIDEYDGMLHTSTLSRLCADAGLWGYLRAGGWIFKNALDEHNEKYKKKSKNSNGFENE